MQGLPQVSITHSPSAGFLVVEVLSPCTGCCEPSSSCLLWGRRKIAQGGDVCFLSPCSQDSWHPQQHITLLYNGVGKNILTIYTSSEGFHLGLSCCNKGLWETQCQRNAGRAFTLPAGRTEPLLGLQAGVASHPPSRYSFQSTWGMSLPVSPPQCAHWDIPAPSHCWEKKGHSEINGFELQYFSLPLCDRFSLKGIFGSHLHQGDMRM